jgi:hypothetical protein
MEMRVESQICIREERSNSPEASMNLLLRFETASGPRTVIACSVPRQVAAEIAEVMHAAGQHAEFVDRCSPLSIADRLLMREVERVPQPNQDDVVAFTHDWVRTQREAAPASRRRSRASAAA